MKFFIHFLFSLSFLGIGCGKDSSESVERRPIVTEKYEHFEIYFPSTQPIYKLIGKNVLSKAPDIEILFPSESLREDARTLKFNHGGAFPTAVLNSELSLNIDSQAISETYYLSFETREKLRKPAMFKIPIINSLKENMQYGLVYHVAKEDSYSLGYIPQNLLDLSEEGIIQFTTEHLGIFQVVQIPVSSDLNSSNDSISELNFSEPPTPNNLDSDFELDNEILELSSRESISIRGSGFEKPLLILGTLVLDNFTVLSNSEISLTLPDKVSAGIHILKILQDHKEQKIVLIVPEINSTDLVFSTNPDLVLSGVNFLNFSNTVSVGTGSSDETASCTSDGQIGCLANVNFKAADMTKAIATNILSGVSIAGVSGSVSTSIPAFCSSDGVTGCVTTSDYKSADMTQAIAANIITGVTIAGTTGTGGVTNSGSCSSDGVTGCVTTSDYKSADMTQAIAANIITGVTIAGTTGTGGVTNSGSCSSDGVTGCVSTATYKSADTSSYEAADIRSGNTIGGVSGTLEDCAADGAQTCFVNSASFYRAANVTGISSSDIALGIDLAGFSGTKRDIRNCRNLANTTTYDNSTSPASSGLDVYDVIDDYDNDASSALSQNPWGSSTYNCDSSNFTISSSGSDYYATDALSGLIVSEANPHGGSAQAWATAISTCKDLEFGGFGPDVWRMPTQKELMQLYIDGISRIDDTNMGSINLSFWAQTSNSTSPSLLAWTLNLADGSSSSGGTKLLTSNVICVR